MPEKCQRLFACHSCTTLLQALYDAIEAEDKAREVVKQTIKLIIDENEGDRLREGGY